jgi:hypothetical protein
MLADLYPKMKNFYVASPLGVRWEPSEEVGGSHRPDFLEFLGHCAYTWDHKKVMDTQRAMQRRHELKRMEANDA